MKKGYYTIDDLSERQESMDLVVLLDMGQLRIIIVKFEFRFYFQKSNY